MNFLKSRYNCIPAFYIRLSSSLETNSINSFLNIIQKNVSYTEGRPYEIAILVGQKVKCQ